MRGIRVLVLGFARSGIAAAKKLVSLGAKVILSEVKPESKVDSAMVKELRTLGVDLEFGGHTFSPVDLIVVSPEIHLDIPVLERARRKNIPIISEIELAYRLLKKPIIAVTGTNGKTTTTTLIGELLKAGGKKVAVAGNIGNPMVEVDDANLDYIVAEISSYQLETTVDFKPWISVILNIQPDHLERHKSMAEYIKQKAKIFANQSADDYLVYNLDEPQVAATVKSAKAKLVAFTKNRAEIIALRPAEIKIPGRHNLENALAAAQAAYLCGVDKNTVADGLKTFPGVEHRIEFVAKIKEVEYYNDSKATNPDSTLVALETFAGRGIVLILGGKDKGVPLAVLAKHVKAGVKEVVLLGEATQRFKKELGFANTHEVNSLEEAVQLSARLAQPGEVVLLSPACASFDMFAD
ncbi:UDP-N-acetylmuramoylalanine--D-glutamate ligase, partial [candidate division WOR-1 bacterium RIFCSPHIGHO2_02_FULL_45_12]